MSVAIILFLLIAVVGVSSTILWVWALLDIARNTALDSGTKIVWVVAIIMLPFIGSIVYLVAGRNQGRRAA